MESKRLSFKDTSDNIQRAISKTLGFKVMGLYLAVIIVVTMFFQVFYIHSVIEYYYDNMRGELLSQAKYNADLFLTYLSSEDLMEVVIENKNQFYRSNDTQVQILNNTGMVLYDSLGTDMVGRVLTSSDVRHAQENSHGSTIGPVQYDDHNVMSLSYPLRSQANQVGIIRLTTSLRTVDALIAQRGFVSVIFGGIVVILSVILAYIVSRLIISPISNLTKVAVRLADGQFNVRADESSAGEIGELAKTMNFMSDNIEKKEKLKNEFISSVSHELRTPLTSIKGWAITLQTPDVPQALNQEGLKIIEQESERLSDMVEDLLDFSRLSSGRIQLKKSDFNIVEIAKSIITQVRPRTRDKQIDMVFNYAQAEQMVMADEGRIKQLLLNIIDNAIKFTPNGGTILTNITEEDGIIRLSVTDTGIGISEEEIDLVTEKFWKGSTSASHTGLGLSICEEIAKAHGGNLEITSRVNVGTTISVNLPIIAG